MNSGFVAAIVLLVSLTASALAASLSGASLTLSVWAVLTVEAGLLALLVMQGGRQLRRLRDQTALAHFTRESADVLTRQRQPEAVLHEAAQLLSSFLDASIFVYRPAQDATYGCVTSLLKESVLNDADRHPVMDAVRWSARNARPVGPGTDNWPEFPFWYVPFSRLPGDQSVLVVEVTQHRPIADMLSFLRGFVDLMAASHDRLVSLQRANDAELSAERQRLQNRFLASISHDMRTPLTGILGASSTLLEQEEQLSLTERRHLLEGLHRQVRYLADTTDNILSLLRLQQSGPDDLVTDWESPEELLGLVLARFPQATEQGKLQASLQPADVLIRANATLIVQALVNLVDNALRLNASFEPVQLQLHVDESRVVFSVLDRGPGFDAQFDIENAVRPLRQDQSNVGAGLGLSIVQAIARVHGAALSADNRKGGGARVQLLLSGQSWATVRENQASLQVTGHD